MILRTAAALVAALVLAAPAAAACTQPRTSLSYLEGQIMCPTCHTTLDQSDAPAALRIEALISKRIAQCWTADQIRAELVQNFGAGILAAPPRKGFDLLAWWLPIGAVIAGAALLAFGVWRWSRSARRRRGAASRRLGPARSRERAAARRSARTIRVMGARLAVSFVAGFASVITPCVLPLVPGYLSAVSSVEAGRLGERGAARRVVIASVPFILGFTVVFVLLGAGSAAAVSVLSPNAQTEVAGFVLVVVGLAFIGLLPVPERVFAPELLTGARRRGSAALLGGAFAVCAAPCIGPVLAAVLVLASDSGAVLRGALLLAVYALGLGAAFLVAGVAFARAMGAFRWLRDRYRLIQIVGGVTLVVLGLLLFFHRDWWLHVALNRALDDLGLTNP